MRFEALKKKFKVNNPAIEKRKWQIQIFLLGIWALIQLPLGNTFYGLYIVAFFITLVIARRQSFILLVLSVLVLVIFNTPILDAFTELRIQI